MVPYASFIVGFVLLTAGILLFSGKTRWGKRNYRIGKAELTHEAVGLLLFFFGLILMLVLLVPLLRPTFLSPGMSAL